MIFSEFYMNEQDIKIKYSINITFQCIMLQNKIILTSRK